MTDARRLLARNSTADATRQLDPFATLRDSLDGIGAAPPDPADLLAGETVADLLGWEREPSGDYLGGWFSTKRLRRLARRGLKVGKGIVRSKLTRMAVAGAAVAFPALAPAAVALEAANRIMAQMESADKTARNLAKKTIRATRIAAMKGDPGAKRAIVAMRAAKKARKETGYLALEINGRRVRARVVK